MGHRESQQRYVAKQTATPELAEAWRARNRERANQWNQRNRERAREISRQSGARSRRLNPERNRLACRQYAAAHREQSRKQARRWQLEHPERYRALHLATEARRRARKRGVSLGTIDYARICKRDRDICGICHQRVPKTEVSFDHIVPIALSGAHEELNLQVAHRMCNVRRGAAWLPAQTRLDLGV